MFNDTRAVKAGCPPTSVPRQSAWAQPRRAQLAAAPVPEAHCAGAASQQSVTPQAPEYTEVHGQKLLVRLYTCISLHLGVNNGSVDQSFSDSSRDECALVEVWRFRRYDIRIGQYVTSIGKAELSAIAGFGAEALSGSMECVPRHRLDGNGIYTPPVVTISPAARRRLERLRAQYTSLIAEEDHGRLDGWAERVESLSTVVLQIDERLALGARSIVQDSW